MEELECKFCKVRYHSSLHHYCNNKLYNPNSNFPIDNLTWELPEDEQFKISLNEPSKILLSISPNDMKDMEHFANLKTYDKVDWDICYRVQEINKRLLGFFQNWDDDYFYPSQKPKAVEEKAKVDLDKQKYCLHDWIKYVGLNESFEYCKKCDLKKGDK